MIFSYLSYSFPFSSALSLASLNQRHTFPLLVIMSGEDDPTREIFGYTSHIPVPVWDEKNAYSNCKHCATKFSAFSEAARPHNCRLCGHIFCSSCTGKYHLPLVYEQKGKKGPTRVCIACRDSCLAQKEKERNATLAAQQSTQPQKHAVLSSKDLNGATGTAAVRPSQFVGGPTPIEIAPPEWDDPDKFIECRKCHKKGGKPHSQEAIPYPIYRGRKENSS